MRIQKRDCPLPEYSEQQEPLRTSEYPKGHWSSSRSVAEATTCYWQKLDCRSVSFSAILLIAFALGTHQKAAESGWLPSQCSGKAVQQKLPCLFSFSQAVTGWASDWENLVCFCPARGGLSLSLRNSTGCEPAQMRGWAAPFCRTRGLVGISQTSAGESLPSHYLVFPLHVYLYNF